MPNYVLNSFMKVSQPNRLKSLITNKEGNIRDYASTIELAILSNLEFYNSKLIEENIPPQTRLIILNNEANKEKELFNKNNEKVLKITNNE